MTKWVLFLIALLILIAIAEENKSFCLERGYPESRAAFGARACVAVVNGTHIVVERDALR